MQLRDNNTRHYQSALASYCRTGVYETIPGVRNAHVIQYRRLVYNVVDDMLQSAYPLTRSLLTEQEWNGLVQDFLSGHACQSPQAWYMPKELYEYVIQSAHPLKGRYPFLGELLWLEWLEIALFMMEDRAVLCGSNGDPVTDMLVLNPEHQLVHLKYPVHLKEAKYITETDKSDYFLAMFREPATGNVQFMQLSPALARMIELLENRPMTVPELADEICLELQLPVTANILNMTRLFINEALENKLISGFLSNK
jgi:hypothetical protein